MLIMKPNCECCDRNLAADQSNAMICSFECTFCIQCMENTFNNRCPNCGGEVHPRPSRTGDLLTGNPASTERVLSRYEAVEENGKTTFIRTRLLPVPDKPKENTEQHESKN